MVKASKGECRGDVVRPSAVIRPEPLNVLNVFLKEGGSLLLTESMTDRAMIQLLWDEDVSCSIEWWWMMSAKFRGTVCVNAKTADRSCEGGEKVLPDYSQNQADFILQLNTSLLRCMSYLDLSVTPSM